MDKIVHQLQELLLGAVPTAVIVFLLFLFLRWSFWRPLERVLAARQKATEGARRDAELALSRAHEKVQQYEEALRQARAEIYREQEARRQEALEERTRLVRETRQRASDAVKQAKLDLARDAELARKDLEAETQRLADQIARSLLGPARPAGGPARLGGPARPTQGRA